MEIRKVNPDMDKYRITSIYNEYVKKTTASFETEPLSISVMLQRIKDISESFPYYVCVENDNVIGYAYAHRWRERAAYCKTLETTVYTDATCKHKGIGTKLMQCVVDDCRRAGYNVLVACITANNTDSIEFHKKIGFIQASHFHNVGEKFGEKLDIIDMEMQL